MSEDPLAQISLNWTKVPNQQSFNKIHISSPSTPNPFQSPQAEFLPSPRSSISSSLSSITPSDSQQGSPNILLNQPSLYNPSEQQLEVSPKLSSSLTLYPESLSFLNFNKERDFGLTAFSHSSPPTNSTSTLYPHTTTTNTSTSNSTGLTSNSPRENTQLALAEIYTSNNQRPQYRSNSFTSGSTSTQSQSILSSPTNLYSPLPSINHQSASLSTSQSSLSSRSYFSTPLPNPLSSRSRSQSSAPVLDRSSSNMSSNTNSSFLSPTSPPFPLPLTSPIDYRTPTSAGNNNNVSSHYSSSLPTTIPNLSSTSLDSRKGFEEYHTQQQNQRPQILTQFGSFSGVTNLTSPLMGGFEQLQQQQSTWKPRSQSIPSASSPSASSFNWEEMNVEREGRPQLRTTGEVEDYKSSWSTGTLGGVGGVKENKNESSSSMGIGLSNMSPFSRDETNPISRNLLDFNSSSDTGINNSLLSSSYKTRRDYSLGAVGSGRKRSDTIWGLGSSRERPLHEAAEEGDFEDSFAPTRSGTTSRRHSVAAFNLPSRSSIGFNLPDNHDTNGKSINTSTSISSGGFTTIIPSNSNGFRDTSSFNSRNNGLGSSAIDDDDLAIDLQNSLQLNLDSQSHYSIPHVGSMPTNFTTRRISFSQEENNHHHQQQQQQQQFSPPSSASRFFQQPPTTTNNASNQPTLSTSNTSSSRFEFGNTSPSGMNQHHLELQSNSGGAGSSNHNLNLQPPQTQPLTSTPATSSYDHRYGTFNLQAQQQQQQQQQSSTFYSTPNNITTNSSGSSGLLSAQTPAFHLYNSQSQPFIPQQQQQQQQQQPYYSPTQLLNPLPPLSSSTNPELTNLGRGVPLHSVPPNAPLYIVEFKAGRKDLFFVDNHEEKEMNLRMGDLVIVEADRGKDIGKFFKLCSLEEVQAFQQRLVENALGVLANPNNQLNSMGGNVSGSSGGGGMGGSTNSAAIARMTKEFQPKKIFGKAMPVDTSMLLSKAQDEMKALTLIRSRVAQKNLAMEICDAEWQWDRRKLTFYYLADSRIDFRELVRELFRLYKTRIWMCCLDQASQWDFK